jgi:von Willebrand factor type A domain/Putative metal-binding motif
MLASHIAMHKTTLLVLLAAPALAHADAQCTPSRLMIVLDKSSSMNDTVDASGDSKWTIAKQAVTEVATTYENKIDLGLNIFPNPNQCAPGKTVVTPGPANANAILAAFGADPPAGGNYTPMAQSIDAAAGDPSLADTTRRPSILLVTDGWQWCSPYDPGTRTWPIDAVQRAKARGITVYVVGFGAAVDAETLNQMALAAGTALPGCDPMDPIKRCYFQADSAAQLAMALDSIAVEITTEVCDGLDNNCDGQIDEGLVEGCTTACGAGTRTCKAGAWGECDARLPLPEVCDGVDNDCNGVVDDGLTRDCSSLCGTGTQTCHYGAWGECSAPPDEACSCHPSEEVCDGVDNDCDGIIDGLDGLCPEGGDCVDGACQSPPLEASASQPDGCGCTVGGVHQGDLGGSILMLALLAGLLLVRRRTSY